MKRGSQFSNQNIGSKQLTHNMHSTLGGDAHYNLYSNEDVPAARAISTTPLGDFIHNIPGGGVSTVSSPMRASGFREGSNRLWNSGNPNYSSSGLPPQPCGLQPQSLSGFSANSVGFSSGQQQRNNETLNNSLGYNTSKVISSQHIHPTANLLSIGANTTTPFASSIPPGHKNDDSLMIERMFGRTSSSAQTSNAVATNSLLTGFNSLSLSSEGDGTKSSGLWGSSDFTETWREKKGNLVHDAGIAAPGISSIGFTFPNEITGISQEGPQESRFNWDSTNINH